MVRVGSRYRRAAIVGSLGLVLSQPLQARQFAAEGVPADVVAKAIAPIVGVAIRACTQQPVSGRRDIRTLADASEFFAGAGLPVAFVGTELQVGCDVSDQALPPGVAQSNIPRGSPLNPFGADGAFYPRPAPVPYSAAPAPPPEPPKVETMTAKWVKRPLLEKVAGALGVKLIFDETPDHPILLAGPADAVADARRYIEAVNVCPAGLTMEASVIQRSDSDLRSSEAGARIGTRSIGFGTAGTSADTGLSFSWLTAFLDARKEVSRFRVNASHSALLLPGEPVVLRNGGEAPVRAATSVTDRETRTDVVYRATGFNLDLTLQAIDGDDALLSVEQSYSSIGAQTELGPAFNNRSFKSVVRVPIDQPSILTVSGDDTVSDGKRRGLLFWGKSTSVSKNGSFLVFKLTRSGCREREPATATSTPKAGQLEGRKKNARS